MCGDFYDEFLISRIFKLVKIVDNDNNCSYEVLLKKFKKLIGYITEELELNNRVYFYGVNSRYKESALSSISKLILTLTDNDNIDLFVNNREKFEDYLIENPEDIQQDINTRITFYPSIYKD